MKIVFMALIAFALIYIAHPAVAKKDGGNDDRADAYRYCEKVKNDDAIRPLTRDLAGDIANAMVEPDREEIVSQTELLESKAIVWRCMSGVIFWCDSGVNIPCGGKADQRHSIPEVKRYCRENPNSAVPAAVSGHGTIYDWECKRGNPIITNRQQVDERGFEVDIWHALVN